MCYITDQIESIDRTRKEEKMRRLIGKVLCRLGLHDWDEWSQGRAFKSRECRRQGCNSGIDLKPRDW